MQQPASPKNAPRPMRQRVLNNLIWFLACLALAFIIWIVATLNADPISEWRLTERVPIRVEPDAGLIVTNGDTLTTQATVYLRGPQSERPLVTGDDVIVTANLAGLGAGTHVVPLSAEVSRGVRVANVAPSQVTVTLEQEAAQFVPVRESLTDPPPPDVELMGVQFDALQAEIRGPQTLVDQVVAVQGALDLAQARTSFQTDVRLTPVDIDGRAVSGLTVTPATARASVELQASESVLELNVRPQLVGELPEGYFLTSIDYDPQIVYISLPSNAPEELPTTAFTSPIDLSERTDAFTVTVPVEMPIVDSVPISGTDITVTIGVEAQVINRQFDDVPVELSGRRQGLTYAFDPGTVTVILTGPQPVLGSLTADDIHVTADVIALTEPGSYRVGLQTLTSESNALISATVLPPEVLVQVSTPTPEATVAPTPSAARQP